MKRYREEKARGFTNWFIGSIRYRAFLLALKIDIVLIYKGKEKKRVLRLVKERSREHRKSIMRLSRTTDANQFLEIVEKYMTDISKIAGFDIESDKHQ